MHHHFIDRYANLDSPLHRRDPRIKLILVLVYSLLLVSVGRYEVVRLVPFAILPFAWLRFGQVPLRFAAKQVLISSPFIVALAIFNPLYDRDPRWVGWFGSVFPIAGGWLIAANITIKFIFGLTTLVALSSTTRFADLLAGMRWLGVPRTLTEQLGLLYRYLFLLIEEAQRLRRARLARLGPLGPFRLRATTSGAMVGALFLRTLGAGGRVHQAMLARGYNGQLPTLSRLKATWADWALLVGGTAYGVLCRWYAMSGG